MYNIFVSSDRGAWNGEPIKLAKDRCVRDFTSEEMKERFGPLAEYQVRRLRRLPSVFAYERQCDKNPLFGFVSDVAVKEKYVTVKYTVMDVDRFLTADQLEEYHNELGLTSWELDRTHWAVKEVDLARQLRPMGINLPVWRPIDIDTHRFQVAVSFPGEKRRYVEDVVRELQRWIGRDACFYDKDYEAHLGRPNMFDLFLKIYSKRSSLVVAFIDNTYQDKQWCGLELRAIDKLVLAKEYSRVMYVRIGKGDVDGILPTDGYLDARNKEPQEVAYHIEERVRLLQDRQHGSDNRKAISVKDWDAYFASWSPASLPEREPLSPLEERDFDAVFPTSE